MKTEKKIFAITILFIFLHAIFGLEGGKSSAMPIDFRYIDPLDTLDEEDVAAMRDTSMLTRVNRTKEMGNVNALDYVLRDRYTPKHQSFDSHWYDHLYVGGSLGIEQIVPQSDVYKFGTITGASIFVGKQFNKTNSLRLSLGAGWGYQDGTNFRLKRALMRLDYLYNLSTHFNGYNPARRVEASLLFGIGGNYSWMSNTSKFFAPEAHLGVQVKCFTGPLGTMSLEPYMGVASDKIDVSGTRNWRGYDLIYGLNVNYAFFLVDNLSKEARQKLLESRLADDRMVDPETIEKWRTPWFVEYAAGLSFSNSSHLDFGKTIGNQTAVSVGRWLSPVIGFRLSAISRSNKWMQVETEQTKKSAAYTQNFNSHYVSGRFEALFNPFGFFPSFSWNAPWGAYLVFGGEMGTLTKYMPYSRLRTTSESYDVGAHFWLAISEDLQAFVEPRYTRNVYTLPYSNANMRQMNGDNNFYIDLGLTMLIRSTKYHLPYEMDHTQNFIYRNIRGVRVGLAAGLPIYQRKDSYITSNKISWNGMAFVEYRFNELHSVRAQAEYLSTPYSSLVDYTDKVTDSKGVTKSQRRKGLWDCSRRMLLTSLDYEISLTNLCGGRLHKRSFELEAFAGPALGVNLSNKMSLNAAEPMEEGQHTITPIYKEEKKLMWGANFGLKLSTNVGKGFSLFLTPTSYLLYSNPALSGLSTVSASNFRFLQTINLGLQYKIGKLRRNPEVVRRIHKRQDADWEQRQMEKMRKAEQKLEEKQAKRRAQRNK